MLSFGDPKPFAPRIKSSGALLICQVQDEAMARQALDAGADILIAQGTEAGGHGASRTTIDIVPAIVDLAAGRVPVAAAGGIGDGRGLAAMMMLGASGVLLGTRFLCQSGMRRSRGSETAHLRCVERQQRPRHHLRSVAQQCLAGAVYRPLPDQRTCAALDGREVELMQNVKAVAAEYAAAKAAGNFDIAAVIAGEAVGLIHDIPPAAEIVDRIVTEAEQILNGRVTPSPPDPTLLQFIQASRTMWPDRRIIDLFKTEFPIVLAPMAGIMDADLVIARRRAGAGLAALRDDHGRRRRASRSTSSASASRRPST
jgi:nitronate monooxygenase